jgi:Predicted ATPase
MRNEQLEPSEDNLIIAKRYAGTVLTALRHEKSNGSPWGSFPKPNTFYELTKSWMLGFEHIKSSLENDIEEVDTFIQHINQFINAPARISRYPNLISNLQEIDAMIDSLIRAYEALGGSESELLPLNEDIPIPFKGDVFVSYLSALAQQTGNEQYLEFLIARIKTMLADSRMDSIISNKTDIELDKWLEKYLGSDKKISFTIIDLSLVPSEIVHVTTAVISRIVFEALQRYRKINGKSLPSVLVMEEAHSFITRYNDNNEGNSSSTCTKVFEKIAREGRKFGLGLVLSSQRPSELSPTVLSQCNSFIMHRISNDRDQELVGRLLPDNFKGLLKELPSLPSQKAILLGWASELPILLKIRDLDKEQRPQSDDPDFWDVWSREDNDGNKVERNIDWKTIADDWQEKDE